MSRDQNPHQEIASVSNSETRGRSGSTEGESGEPKVNILLVGDREDKLLALEGALFDLHQNIVKARSGEDALRHLMLQDFAVVLLDVTMPGTDGFETAASIRKRLNSEHTPIIFVTSISDPENQIAKGYALGAVDYIPTPIVSEVLRAKVSVFVDLHKKTARKTAEEEIRSLNNELKRRVNELTEINKELEAFSYSISHDLRAPLRAMQGFAQALLEDCDAQLGPHGKDYARRIVKSAIYMDTLLRDLLDYSRLSRLELEPIPVDLEVTVADVLAQFENPLRERHAEVVIQRPLAAVVGHPSTLRQILSNLVSNALKFVDPARRPGLRIWTRAHREGMVRIWFEDNGIGIAPDHQERIFGLFQRLHNTESYPGTGIGLALVRKGAERMGGRAGVESNVGKGSRFWVELPAPAHG